MSYVSGKNAARVVMSKFPALFQNSNSYPAIKVRFWFLVAFNEEGQFSDYFDLMYLI